MSNSPSQGNSNICDGCHRCPILVSTRRSARMITTYLIATVTYRVVTHVAARSAEAVRQRCELGVPRSRSKAMARMMAMLKPNMARYAKIIVLADETCDKVGLVENYIMSAYFHDRHLKIAYHRRNSCKYGSYRVAREFLHA